jgi:hypothetical protein
MSFVVYLVHVMLLIFITPYTYGNPIPGMMLERAPWNQQPTCQAANSFKYPAVWDELWAQRRILCSGGGKFVPLSGWSTERTVSFKNNGKIRNVYVKFKSYLDENHGEQGYGACYVCLSNLLIDMLNRSCTNLLI